MKIAILLALLALAACDRGERPQAPTPEEAARLDEAEAMLNGLANEQGAASSNVAPPARSND
jgi:hypothetical protein